jgi:hypothetical protein
VIDYFIFFWAVSLLAIGLILEASGFGIFVVGRPEGIILVIIGLTMFWVGWVLSGARSFSCVVAAILNMFDAAFTVAFWNFESNPVVLATGPTVFMVTKVAWSLTIMLYAKLHVNPRRGGIAFATFFAFIIAWNLSQHAMISLGFRDFSYGIFVGSILSFVAALIVLYVLFRSEKYLEES